MKSEDVAGIYAAALDYFLAGTIDNPKGRAGGHFTVVSTTAEEDAFVVLPVGKPEAGLPTDRFAVEKASRIIGNPGHCSSFQSRNPDAGQWGGAIRANDQLIFSMSGMPEHVDEAINLAVALKSKEITEARLLEVSEASQNPYLDLVCGFAEA